MFILFGVFANKGIYGHRGGMVLFALDCVIFVLGQDGWAWAFSCCRPVLMFRGFPGSRNLRAA